jgi:NitT/TauT family transport system ATP-binding protein
MSESKPGELALELSDVQFGYGAAPVIDRISLGVPAGSAVGLVSPSGCGKSTLLGLVSGLLRADEGDVRRSFRDGRHPLAMVFQKDTTLPWLTVEENVRFYTRLKRNGLRRSLPERLRLARRQDPIADHVRMLLEMGGLAQASDRYPNQLSGGMRRRLAFLMAMAPNPQVLLLDEPFSSVDEPTRVGIHQDVHEITRSMGTTLLLVTHDLAEAITLCDRVIVLSAVPARIAEELEIPFGRDRQMLELREQPVYADVYRSLWRGLSRQIALQRESRPVPAS